MTDDDLERIREAIFAGRKIEAIKLYRQSTGQGLKQAKDAVELLESELRRAEPERFSASSSTGIGCSLFVLALLAVVGVVLGIMT